MAASSVIPTSKDHLSRPALTALMLACLFGLLFALYGNWLMRITPAGWQRLWAVVGPLVSFLNPLYGSVWKVSGALYECLALVVIAWHFGRPVLVARALLAAGAALALAYPLWLPQAYSSYALHAQAAPGYELRWLTPPASGLSSALKEAQRVHEKETCPYQLHGWTAANLLYYASPCLPGHWRYDPASGGEPAWVLVAPRDMAAPVLGSRHDYPQRPTRLAGRWDWYIVYQVSTSPDGQWLAAAIRNYYGPSDVVVVGPSGAGP